jgi:hypothetical protein
MMTPAVLTLVLASQVSAFWVVPWFAWNSNLFNGELREAKALT